METTRVDAVGLVREIRDAQAPQWGDRPVEDVIAFFHQAAAELLVEARPSPSSSRPEPFGPRTTVRES